MADQWALGYRIQRKTQLTKYFTSRSSLPRTSHVHLLLVIHSMPCLNRPCVLRINNIRVLPSPSLAFGPTTPYNTLPCHCRILTKGLAKRCTLQRKGNLSYRSIKITIRMNGINHVPLIFNILTYTDLTVSNHHQRPSGPQQS